MADPTVFVAAPHRETRRGGIKSLGDFVTTPRLGAASNIDYLSNGCSFPSLTPAGCWTVGPVGPDKTIDGIDRGEGILTIFGQYAGVECFLGNDSADDYSERARHLLETGEAHEVEAALHVWADGTGETGTGAGIVAAVAAAEEYADQFYLGRPVILMSRSMAVQAGAADALGFDAEGKKWTANGTPVIASWTLPEDAIYVIGWPTVYVSDITVSVGRDWTHNTEMAIAERNYGIAVDCDFRYKVDVTEVV
jgi:hypothetical protein